MALSSDILVLVFGKMDLQSVLNTRQACKEFYEVTKWRSLWDTLLHRYVISDNIPIPGLHGRALSSLNSQELENALRRALKLRQNWLSSLPTVTRETSVIAAPASRIIGLVFLPTQRHHCLISLTMMHGPQRLFELQGWDLSRTTPVCVGRKELRRFRGIAFNKTEGKVAITSPNLEILSLDSTEGLITTAILQESPVIHAFSGSRLLTRDNDVRLFLWDLNSPDKKTELRNPRLESHIPVLDAILASDFVLTCKVTTLELYALPPNFKPNTANVLHPVAQFKWPWRVDNAVMTVRSRPRKDAQLPAVISILVRFGSYFPWSINLLHHYELQPNPSYTTAVPLSEMNLPFLFPPVLRETIGSPVRLHATSDICFGSYGTAVWTDSHTEDYFGHANRGQRLAGKFTPTLSAEDEESEVELSDQIPSTAATSVYSFQEEDSWVKVALDETEGRIALGCSNGQISILEYV